MSLKNVSIMTLVLFILSISVYLTENKRGADLAGGADFIKGIDINSIKRIELEFSGNSPITFEKDTAHFVISNKKSYPASTSKINELIFNIANIQVREKITSTDDKEELKSFGLSNENMNFRVRFFDQEDRKTISFIVGKSKKNKGNYLLKEGTSDVYLSQNRVRISSTYKNFLDQGLVSLNKNEIKKIQISSNQKVSLFNEAGIFKKSKNNQAVDDKKFNDFLAQLNNLTFDNFYSVTDPNVQTLNYSKEIKVELNNSLSYDLRFTENNNKYYLKVNAAIDDLPKQITVSQEDGKQELMAIEEQIKAQSTAQLFNMKKASWVYEINKNQIEKLLKSKSELL